MKSIRLMKAIGSVDDELLEAYEKDNTKPMKKRPWVKWSALAACLCIIVVGALTIPGLLTNNEPAPQEDSSIGEKNDEERPVGDKMLVINGSGYDGSAASYVTPEAGTTLFFIEVRDAIEDYRGTDARLFLGININTAFEEMLTDDSEEMRLETERLASLGYEIGWYESWTYQGQGEKTPCTYLYGLFTVEELESFAASPDYGYSFYFRHNGDGSAVAYTGTGEIVNAETENGGTTLAPAELTEAEVYAEIGAFLPASTPDGFVFESAYLSNGAVSALWTGNDYGELSWTISDMTDAA